jgi:hypothetical protein
MLLSAMLDGLFVSLSLCTISPIIPDRLRMRTKGGQPLLTQRASALTDTTARLNLVRRDFRRLRRAAVDEEGWWP